MKSEKKAKNKKKEFKLIKVTGLTQRDENEAVALLRLKLKSKNLGRTFWKDGALIINCIPQVASQLRAMNGKVVLAGKNLEIDWAGKNNIPQKQVGSAAIEKLQLLVRSRYDPQKQFLDLSNLISDPILKDTGLDFNDSKKLGPVICKIMAETCPGLKTLNLQNNMLDTTIFFGDLSERVPDLENISLMNNKLTNYKVLEFLKGHQFTNLRELLLRGNPLLDNIIESGNTSGEINFKSRIKSMFPTLKLLDGVPLIEEIEFGIKQVEKLPLSTKVAFSDNPSTLSTAQNFLLMYFDYFDKNRNNLGYLYHEKSLFSLSINSTDPKSNFQKWFRSDRNLKSAIRADIRVKNLHIGAENIVTCLTRFPRTEHPITEPATKKLFIFDTFMYGEGADMNMYIHVHGEFKEEKHLKRSFDRLFVLGPAPPESQAALAGVPVVIHNDMLTVKAHQGNINWKDAEDPNEKKLSDYPQLPPIAILDDLKKQNGLTDEQQGLVIEFSKHTGLNYGFSLQCLRETGWAPDKAVDAFNIVKATIPPEAFKL